MLHFRRWPYRWIGIYPYVRFYGR